ncbi:MAG TPA: hypothetical protein VMV94_04410 [Phycisphaerae bacterium]|nr:hypothetical protein [Phycisphaerae bacterium]
MATRSTTNTCMPRGDARSSLRKRMGQSGRVGAFILLLAVSLAGCGTPFTDLLTRGSAFITQGTAQTRDAFAFGPCLAWVDTTGAVYQLFQGENVSNADFDRVTTPGVTSRLKLTVRTDLIVGCRVGTTAVVDEVLQ